MRSSPSIVPEQAERDVYLVLDDLGARLGRAWRETSEEDTDRETLIRYLLEGQYRNPNWIIAFNIREGWVRDATQDIADGLRKRIHGETPLSLQYFLELH